MNEKRETKVIHALVSITAIIIVMFTCVVNKGLAPHVAMLIGCGTAVIIGFMLKYTWEEMLEGMIGSITQSLEAIIILILIGALVGIWILSGVVPTMIFYGLKLLTPRFFLVSTTLICSLVSMAIGSWGTAGTVGIAFMGIAQAMDVPSSIAAAAIISGSYVGDKLSPLSDSCNLAAAVTNVNIFDYLPRMVKLSLPVYGVVLGIYGVIGWNYGNGVKAESMDELNMLIEYLRENFMPRVYALIPLLLLIICIIKKVPAIPSMTIGIAAGALYGFFAGEVTPFEILSASYSGYVSSSGIDAIDNLLTAGGIESMYYTIFMIIIAMMFGGIMEVTGQMDALVRSVVTKVKSFTALTITTVLTAISVNTIIPEQYLAIALPGRMYAREYDKHNIDRIELTMALGVGASLTSPLIPWNTCGIFMSGVLGVSTYEYAPYCFMNLLMPVVLIIYAMIKQGKMKEPKTKR